MYSKPLRYAPLSFVILDDMQFDVNIFDEKQKVENIYVCDIFIHSGICLLHCESFLYLDVNYCIVYHVIGFQSQNKS